jgi:acyl-CoA reductase-like NAD-dependent aldehyde dehydrogenase
MRSTTPRLTVEDKHTGETIAQVALDDRATLHEKVHRAFLASARLRAMSLEERLGIISRVGELMADQREHLVHLLVREAGQPRKFAQWEVERAIQLALGFPERVDVIRPQEFPAVSGRNLLTREPYGLVGLMTPRNAPLAVPFFTIASSLVAGNAVVVKPSNQTPLSCRRLAELIWDNGCPPGALQYSTCPGEETAAEFIENPEVDVFMIYASSPVGKDNLIRLGRYLEQTRRTLGDCFLLIEGKMKKYVPELAGNDPLIVMAGADLENAVEAAVVGGFSNSGQLCIAAKRFLVDRRLADAFRDRLLERIASLKIGDPNAAETDIGPIGRDASLNMAKFQVEEALQEGGHLLVGGRAEAPFFHPTLIEFDKGTLLNRRTEEKPFLWVEESFAPVRSLVVFDTLEEAVLLANDTHYGLGASLFGPTALAQELAQRLNVGRVMINEGPLYGDPWLPVGGVKDSGLNGATDKLEEVTYVKRIHLAA